MVLCHWRRWFPLQATLAQHPGRKERSRVRLQRPQFESLEDRFAPATHTWTGGLNTLWSADRNWIGGSPAGDNNAALIFPANARTATNNDLDNLTIQSMSLVSGEGNYALTGQPITLTGGINSVAPSGTANNISFNITLASTQTWNVTGNLLVGGTVTLSAGIRLMVITPDTTTFAGALNGSGGLAVAAGSTGAVVLSAANAYSGPTAVNSGTLRVGIPDAVPNTSAVTVAAGATIDLNKFSDTIGSLAGAGNVNLGGSVLITGSDNTSTTFSGIISGPGGLTKAGTGTLILSGANTYSSTLVAAGTLLVNGAQATNIVTVNSSATLGGSGIVGTTTAIGAISPGGPGTAVLRSGDTAFIPGSSFIVKINGATPGIGYDQLNAAGPVSLAGNPTLSATAGFAAAIGDSFTILTSSSGIAGTFSGLANNASLSISGQTFQISYTSNSVALTRITAPTTTSLTSAPNASILGQLVTFTAVVTPAAHAMETPTGAVTFKEGSETLGTGTFNAGGVATFTTTTPLTVGSHVITATYNGDRSFAPSTSSPVTQIVNRGVALTTLTSSANPFFFSQPVTFTATVAAVPGTPTGNVVFREGSTTLGNAALDRSGRATLTTSALNPGTHTVTAEYSGDSTLTATTSESLIQTINQALTTSAVSASPNPSVSGQPVIFTATVSAVVGTPSGNVVFREGSTTLGTAALDRSGRATLTTFALSPGTHTVTAEFGGDSTLTASTSAPLTQTINQALTTTAVSASPNPSVSGQPVIFTATISALSPASGTPTGTVTFKDGLTTLGVGTLDASGHATLTTSALATGSHAIATIYSGDANFIAASSVPVTQTINPAAATVTVTSSTNRSTFGQPVTFTAVVRVVPPGDRSPSGSVTFQDGTTTLGTVSLDSAGTATFTAATLSGGNHAITAVYSGDTDFAPSTSPAFSQVVASSPNEAYVTALYRNVLERLPDAVGFNFWVQQLQAGASRTAVASAFETSVEYRSLEVNRFYEVFLHRAADVVGKAFWVNALVSGQSEADVVVAFLTSTEYTAAHHDAASYVRGLYQDVLGHAADPAGASFWQDVVQRGAQSRGQVALSFLSSPEAYFQAIDSYYANFLGRPADSAGRQAYFAALQGGKFTPTGITTAFLASDEFLARAIALAGG
jgi:autotransporter-associated beta strand protein